ncbi:MAG: divergent polysaccharide deacetylase family protein [Rhodospirillales bacterium]|nr:divergent polysaccharide deacetylase family protein [Rhodospirillales bacterium]
MELMHSIQERFSFKSFARGMFVVLAIYGASFGYAFLQGDVTREYLQSRLASQSVLIDGLGEPAFIETQDHLGAKDLVEAPSSTHGSKQNNTENSHEENTRLENIVDKSAKALSEAPVEGLFEDSAFGRLPIAKNAIETPFAAYRKPFVLNQGRPFIAVAVEQFGLSNALSEEMIAALPSSVSFILTPYSQSPEKWTREARTDGHEVWLHLPMENKNFPLEDPGAKGLLTRVSLQYNQDRIQWLMGRTTGYAGVAAYTDDTLDNAGQMFKNMAHDLFKRGLGFLELNREETSFFEPIAEEMHAPHTEVQSYIDVVDPQRPAIKKALEQIDAQGGTLVVVRPSPRNIPALKRWLESLQKRGIEIVPVSAVAAANNY